jgi:hypothetical protein
MKQIFTLLTVFVLVATAFQNNAAVTTTTAGSTKPTVSPNPAHDYIKVNWQQNQCDNVMIALYYANGTLARTLTNRQYCDGNYNEMFKIAGFTRGSFFVKVMIGTQIWSYKVLLY